MEGEIYGVKSSDNKLEVGVGGSRPSRELKEFEELLGLGKCVGMTEKYDCLADESSSLNLCKACFRSHVDLLSIVFPPA